MGKACMSYLATSFALSLRAIYDNIDNSANDLTQGVAALEVEVQPQPLTPHFFSTRTRDINASVSSAIHSTFMSAGLLDKSGFLQDDPR